MSKESHWAEANKFALETAKTIFLLANGVSVAVLAIFRGQVGSPILIPSSIKWALVAFMFSAVGSILLMALGYLTNLFYGNSEAAAEADAKSQGPYRAWRAARKLHIATYFASAFALGGVIAGMLCLMIYLLD